MNTIPWWRRPFGDFALDWFLISVVMVVVLMVIFSLKAVLYAPFEIEHMRQLEERPNQNWREAIEEYEKRHGGSTVQKTGDEERARPSSNLGRPDDTAH